MVQSLDWEVFGYAVSGYCHLVVSSCMTVSLDLGLYRFEIVNSVNALVLVGAPCEGWVGEPAPGVDTG